ncbi:MAG: lysophospholipid acyltransferase family protein [Anaerofustis sp.]
MLYKFSRICVAIYVALFHRFKIIGKEHIPINGRVIICANHQHLIDPMLVAICTRRIICFMAKKELFEGAFGFLIKRLKAIPVNRDGNDSYSLKLALSVLKKDGVLGIFPEGTRIVNRTNAPKFKSGVAMLAIKTKTPIIPIYIEGSYKPFGKLTAVVGEAYELSEYYDRKLSSEEYAEISNHRIARSILDLNVRIGQNIERV